MEEQMVIPAFVAAMQDRTLRGNARDVYLWCHEHLDIVQFRPVKHSVIESALQMKDSSIADALQVLIDRGYLDRGERCDRLWTYRLYYSRNVLPPIPEQKSA